MAESILVTGKKISSMELVTNVTGNEKIPTGQPDDLAVTPNQIADHTIARGDLVSQEDLSQVEVSLGTQIADLTSDVASNDNSVRGLIAAEEAARIAADNLKVDKEGSVSSVAGRVGDVVLAPSDVLVEGFGSQEDVNKYVAKPFLSGYTYGLGERVVLNGGEVVKSTVEGNVSDPNGGMVGWVSVVSDSLTTTVQTFNTPEAGVDPVTGVADGSYFNVRSEDDGTIAVEYLNVGGSAVATGKSYLSSLGVQLQEKPASTIKDASGKWQQEINDEQELLNADQAAFNSRFTNIKDKPTLQQIINSFSAQPDPIKRGDILFNSAEDVDVPEQIEINQGRIKLEGRNSVLKWTGTDPAKAVLRVYDSSMTVIKDMAILGDTESPPLAAVLYDNNNAALIGSNEMNVLENVIIGRKVLSDNTRSFRCTYGVYVRPGGYGNNDQFTLRNVAANDTLEAAFFVEGDQHIWSTMDSCLANIGKVGFKLGSNMTLNNAQCNRLTEVDFEAIRNIEVWINGMFSEHPKMAIKSTGGSFYVKGGKVLKNPTVKEPIIQFISGGFLSLDGVLFASTTNPHLNYIEYNGGSVKDGGVLIRGCNLANGHKRDYYKIHTATNGWKEHTIDISCAGFEFKTTAPYSDEAKAGVTANANSSAVFSSAQASKLGRGKFFHSAISTNLPTGVQVPVCVDASVYRVHAMNRTGANIAIGDCNVRGMELSDRLLGSNFAAAQDLVFASGRGIVKVNVPLLGVKKGDYIVPSSTTATYQAPMYGYATADNVATVVVETMSSVPATLAAQVIGAAKFDESKARFHAQKQLAETTVASKTYTTIDIDCAGVQVGSHCLVSSSEDLSDLLVTAHCSIDGKIRATIYNPQSTPVIIPADTILKVCAVF